MEIKALVDHVSREHGIKRDVVVSAVTTALEKAVAKKYPDFKIEAQYDEQTGVVSMFHFKTVVEVAPTEMEMLDEELEINLPEARKIDPSCEIGDEMGFPLEIDLGRIAASIAKQVMMEAIVLAENEVAYKHYLPLKGTIVTGIVQRADHKGALITLGKVEGFIPKYGMVETERLGRNQSVEVFVENVTMEKNKVKIELSRSAPEMVIELFKDEVPELKSGEITMKFCAREAGVKSKFIVDTTEKMNPVAICIGTQGNRIQKVQHRLGGERIDVVQFSHNQERFVQGLLGVKRLKSFAVDEETRTISVEIENDEVARAVGPRGANVKLASLIMDYAIKINRQEAVTENSEVK